jgi:hypothetical protein
LHRFEATATIKPGSTSNLAGERIQLVRIVLTDDGPVLADSGNGQHRRPDVVCPLRPSDASPCAAAAQLADHTTTNPETR